MLSCRISGFDAPKGCSCDSSLTVVFQLRFYRTTFKSISLTNRVYAFLDNCLGATLVIIYQGMDFELDVLLFSQASVWSPDVLVRQSTRIPIGVGYFVGRNIDRALSKTGIKNCPKCSCCLFTTRGLGRAKRKTKSGKDEQDSCGHSSLARNLNFKMFQHPFVEITCLFESCFLQHATPYTYHYTGGIRTTKLANKERDSLS